MRPQHGLENGAKRSKRGGGESQDFRGQVDALEERNTA